MGRKCCSLCFGRLGHKENSEPEYTLHTQGIGWQGDIYMSGLPVINYVRLLENQCPDLRGLGREKF